MTMIDAADELVERVGDDLGFVDRLRLRLCLGSLGLAVWLLPLSNEEVMDIATDLLMDEVMGGMMGGLMGGGDPEADSIAPPSDVGAVGGLGVFDADAPLNDAADPFNPMDMDVDIEDEDDG